MTTQQLADIGAAAAVKASNRVCWMMSIQKHPPNLALGTAAWDGDAPAREAFAQAVAEKVRKEGAEERKNLIEAITAEQFKKHEALSIIEQAIEMVNTPGTTAETLPKAINVKIMERDQFHQATLKKLDMCRNERDGAVKDANSWEKRYNEQTATAAAIAKERDELRAQLAEKEFDIDKWRQATCAWEAQYTETLKQMEEKEARLAKLEWRYRSIEPTAADGDKEGLVEILFEDGRANHAMWHVVKRKGYPFWRPVSSPPAPSPEEVERREFEEWYSARCADSSQHKTALREAMFDSWQAARAGKEGR